MTTPPSLSLPRIARGRVGGFNQEADMRLNVAARNAARTHEGAPAVPGLSDEKMLRRSVLSCMLWEDEFYEDGQSIAARIVAAAEKVEPAVLARLAIEAREVCNL